MNRIDNSEGNYLTTKKFKGFRVIFNSWTQNREGTMGEKAYLIKEVAVYNPEIPYSTASQKALNEWTLSPSGNGNDISKDTGGNDIHLRIYYDPRDIE